jgi:hypothetical protein
MFADVSPGWGIASSVIAAVSGLGGVGIGGLITSHTQKVERKNARIRQQLQEFYSPLLGMRSEIKAKSDIRHKLHSVANVEWAKLLVGVDDPSEKQRLQEGHWPRFEKLAEHSETQLRDELIPLYRQMLDYYSTHMWLAEKSTLSFYPAFTEFVELWNRHLSGSLPFEVIKAIDHKESDLFPFYEDLRQNFDLLSDELKK